MLTQSGPTKRPTCASCSKPIRICLCNRLQAPRLDNSVSVTILQHSLEKNHPLNSTRIATLGFINVDVVTVSDVNFQARFSIRLLSSANCRVNRVELGETRHVFDEMPSEGEDDDMDFDRQIIKRSYCSGCTSVEEAMWAEKDETLFDFTIGKYGVVISSFINCRMAADKSQEIKSFSQLLASDIAIDGIRKGFVVKKYKNEEYEEFEIAIHPGSVLLFPSEQSVNIDAVSFEIKNLIVLDGTWPKAKRMYNENPWLRLLPHVRLDFGNKSSLYGEVRQQPKDGYLSTIESIVYAMKAVGKEEDFEGLDGLLNVFESMVEDQRRCKIERLSKGS